MRNTYFRFVVLIIVNILVFAVFFGVAEIGYRIYCDGITKSVTNISNLLGNVPYSNLGTSNWVIFDKELGYRLNPNKNGINSFSIRHGNIKIPKPNGLHRILYLGDSIPWDEAGFVDQTRKLLEKRGNYEVINAAVQGYTSYQEVLFYEKHLKSIRPDLVIWTYCLNDNYKFLHRFDEKAKMLWTKEAEKSLEINSFWDQMVSRSYFLTKLHLILLSKSSPRPPTSDTIFGWEDSIDFNIAWKEYSWKDHEQQIVKLKNILAEQDTELAIIIFPYEPQLLIKDSNKHANYITKPQQYLYELCKKHNIPYLDLYPKFKEEYSRNKVLYRDGIHLNPDGHALATQQIMTFLKKNDLLEIQ